MRQLGKLLILAVGIWFLAALQHLEQGRGEAAKVQLEETLARSAVACYAAEGTYPQSVAYLEEHYGVRIDWDRYAVSYDAFAENLMPDITVLEK